MNRMFFSRLVCPLVALLVLGLPLAGAQPEQPPNIVFIFTDDQGPWAWSLDDPEARTPNLDRIAQQGARLVNSFTTTPVCSPSRAAMMASRYGTELGITDYINPSAQPDLGLDPAVITWPEMLSQAGYATGLVGKWHLGSRDRYHPTRQGFSYFAGFRTGGSTSQNPNVEVEGRSRVIQGWTPDILTDHAIQFVRGNRDAPFLLSLHFWAPHANTANRTPDGDRTWLPLSDADWSQFENLDPTLPEPDYPFLDVYRTKRMRREYLASVSSVDRNVGRLLRVMDELELSGNTVVIFSSDHGYNMGHHGIWHKGNGRWLLQEGVKLARVEGSSSDGGHESFEAYRVNLWDNSLKVPTAVRWPGVIQAGTVIEESIGNLDWYPTILAMAGVDLPAGETIRGRNFFPLLKGEPIDDWDNDFYAQYSQDHGGTKAQLRCWRTPEWKLVRDFLRPGLDELYDLKRDPEERTNLISSQDPNIQRMRARLNRLLLAKMQEIGDPAARQGLD